MLKSIVSIYKDRALPDVLREIYDNGMQLYISLENSDNPFNLFSSGLWPVPNKITWELLYVMDDEDADCVRLRIIHLIPSRLSVISVVLGGAYKQKL